jgi:hypothetical protein
MSSIIIYGLLVNQPLMRRGVFALARVVITLSLVFIAIFTFLASTGDDVRALPHQQFAQLQTFFQDHSYYHNNNYVPGDDAGEGGKGSTSPAKHVEDSDSMSKIFLSIIILTYNNSPLVNRTLYSLLRYSDDITPPWHWEILLVDNGCFPSTRDVFDHHYHHRHHTTNQDQTQSMRPRRARYIPLCNNTRYSVANNLAARQYVAPSAQWLLFLNDDVVPQQGRGRGGGFLWNFHALLSAHTRRATENTSSNNSERGAEWRGGHGIGAVGCKLLFENHRIVEAGSLILASGKTDNYLRCVYVSQCDSNCLDVSKFVCVYYVYIMCVCLCHDSIFLLTRVL